MKSIKFMLMLLLFVSVAHAQNRQDITAYRGDKKTITINPVTGNHATRLLRLAVKETGTITADRLVYKTSSDSSITAVYDSVSRKTRITISLDRSDTWDLNPQTYIYDMESVSASDSSDVITIVRGNLVLTGDVLTPFDGTDLPDDAERYFPVLLTELGAGKVPKVNSTEDDVEGIEVYDQDSTDALLAQKLNKADSTLYATQHDLTTGLAPKITLSSLSSTATGLSYNNSTGVFSLSTGYIIPTTTQETNWNTAYSHASLTNNPHSVTKAQVGLTNVTDNAQIYSLNSLTAQTQSLAIGTTGTAPNWVSGTSTHTLHIPMASAANVTAGLISKADYDIFNAKQAALVSGTNIKTINTYSILGSGGISLNKSDVGLSNVDNTSDATKNSATATLTNKTLSAPVITGITDVTNMQLNRGIYDRSNRGGYRFDDTDDYTTHTFTQKNYGVSFWIFPTVTNKAILNFGTNMGITFNSSNVITYGASFANTSTYVNGIATTTLTLNTWQFVQCFYDEITPTVLEVGRVSTTYFTGKFNELRVWNRALTTAEKIAYYNNGEGKPLEFSDRGANNTEIVTNGTMEADANWVNFNTPTSNARSDEQAHSGTYSRKFTANVSSGISSSNFSVVAGKRYKISAWIYGDGTNGVSLRLRNGTANISSYPTIVNGDVGYVFPASWTQVTWEYEATMSLTDAVVRIYTGSGASGATIYVDDVSITLAGNVAEYNPEQASSFAWFDNSGNMLHGQTSGSPISLWRATRPENYRDIKTVVTGNTTLASIIPQGYMLKAIIANNTTANTATINISAVSSGGTDILNGGTLAAGLNAPIVVNKIFSITAARTIYLQSANWNSSSSSFTFVMEKVQ